MHRGISHIHICSVAAQEVQLWGQQNPYSLTKLLLPRKIPSNNNYDQLYMIINTYTTHKLTVHLFCWIGWHTHTHIHIHKLIQLWSIKIGFDASKLKNILHQPYLHIGTHFNSPRLYLAQKCIIKHFSGFMY